MGIAASVLGRFRGGVHPPENKALSAACAIEPVPLPKRLNVPLHQHIGKPAEPCVNSGQKVLKGQLIAKAEGFVSAPVHAPTSGTIVDFVEVPSGHPSGIPMLCAVLEADGEDKWIPDPEVLAEPLQAEPGVIRQMIRDAGIVGLGGATFPSYIKMSPPKDKVVEALILNGVECEPYLTCDARLMEERAEAVVAGAEIMLHALQTRRCIIGIEANKPAAIRAMREAVSGRSDMKVEVLPVMYPQGAEKQLIQALIHREVPSGGLPIDVGVIVHNVATAVAIRNAICFGQPLISRLVTMTGKGIGRPANLEVLIGTSVAELIAHCGGLKEGVEKVVMGGPMMGVALHQLDVPVVKGTSGILALFGEDFVSAKEQTCIRCCSCMRVCPIGLMPNELSWLAKSDQFDRLQEYNLFDCIECGSCAYVCPSNIPLVHYFRYGKFAIQSRDRERAKTELSRARTQAREDRLAREKAERERKKEEMKAQMAAKKGASATPPAATEVVEPGVDKASRAVAAKARAVQAERAASQAMTGETPPPPVDATPVAPTAQAPAPVAAAPVAPAAEAPAPVAAAPVAPAA
ncbi:MAG: electron transport complex subunit RsxC, partial [Magnetococcales bacterium]|nr:electron transport complex subunit RsxC [Magnetococcales bacterium]